MPSDKLLQADDDALRVKRLSENAKLPTRATPGSVGYDLYAAAAKTVPARSRALIPLDIRIAVPTGCYARIAARSGFALRHGITVGAGVIDPDYRGDLSIILFNTSEDDFKIEQGDRVAQMVLERVRVAPVKEVDELEDTDRGAGGFGSTGRT